MKIKHIVIECTTLLEFFKAEKYLKKNNFNWLPLALKFSDNRMKAIKTCFAAAEIVYLFGKDGIITWDTE